LALKIAPVGKSITLLIPIEVESQIDLAQVREAGNTPCPLLRTCQRRQEQRRKDGDDRDHDQQFNQRECPRPPEPPT
jgi:hypothetical protein